MAEISKKKRGRPPKSKENFPKLTPGQERAKKAWDTRRSKANQSNDKIPQTNDMTLEKIKSALESTKADIADAINKLSSMGLTVHKLGLKSTDSVTKLSDITILLNL